MMKWVLVLFFLVEHVSAQDCVPVNSVTGCKQGDPPGDSLRCCDGAFCNLALKCVRCLNLGSSGCVSNAQNSSRCCRDLFCVNGVCSTEPALTSSTPLTTSATTPSTISPTTPSIPSTTSPTTPSTTSPTTPSTPSTTSPTTPSTTSPTTPSTTSPTTPSTIVSTTPSISTSTTTPVTTPSTLSTLISSSTSPTTLTNPSTDDDDDDETTTTPQCRREPALCSTQPGLPTSCCPGLVCADNRCRTEGCKNVDQYCRTESTNEALQCCPGLICIEDFCSQFAK